MNDLRHKPSFWLLLVGFILGVMAVLATVIYTSIEAPDPASQTPEGAPPPQGEPVHPIH